MNSKKWLVPLFFVLGIVIYVGYIFVRFFNFSVPSLESLTPRKEDASAYELAIRNESAQLEVIKNPLASFPNNELKEILDFNGVSRVVFVITDTPQIYKNVWDENGEKLEFSSYSVLKPTDNELEVYLYLNKDLLRRFNWVDQSIARYINYAFYTALLLQADRSQGAFDQNEKTKVILEQERILLFTFKDV